MLEKINLNNDWIFEGKEKVRIPHTVKVLPFNYFDEKIYQGIYTYEKDFDVEVQKDKHYIIHFDGILHSAKIYLNDEFLLEHLGGYDSFKIDLTDKIKSHNHLKVIVNSNENQNIPPFGKVVDYITYGGIYREVYLDVLDKNYIDDIFIKPYHKDNWYVILDLKLNNKCNANIKIKEKDKIIYDKNVTLEKENMHKIDFSNPILWDINNPFLYKLIITINTDVYEYDFGLRTAVFKTDGFYLNDKKLKLLGINRHQSYPYIGYAAPKRMQENDAYIIKYELGLNAVRTSHYMQSKHFLNYCDKIGLLVFTETPGWQYLGDEKWQELVIKNMYSMFDMNKNHPSVILYGARINESVDNHDLYKKTNELLRSLDDTRQTGGVRCYQKGEELEDVYTYNDFLSPKQERGLSYKKDIVKSKNMPYFVSEFNGHMFPTKNYDDSAHQEEHLRRITKGINELYNDNEILGLFIWCFADYNTHKEFGSGDKICYHGLCDMFRNPKVASYILQSQNKNKGILLLSNNYIKGDYPASSITGLTALTNLDSIKVYKNNIFIKEYNHNDTLFKNIPNTPILIDDLVGNQLEVNEGYTKKEALKMKSVLNAFLKYEGKLPFKYLLTYLNLMLFHHVNFQKGYELYGKYIGGWGDKEVIYKFEGIKDGNVVKSITLGDSSSLHLDINSNTLELEENETYDVASIRLKVLDQNNNLASYYNEPFEIETTSNVSIIGPKLVSFKGGMSGTYIKTNENMKGNAKITFKTAFETKSIDIIIK